MVGPSILAGTTKQWERQNITNDQLFEVPLAATNFDKTKVLKRVALIPGHTQPILQRFYCKISLGKTVSIQEKGIPKFSLSNSAVE